MKRIKVGYQRHVIQSSRFFSDTAMVATGPSLADLVALSRSHMAHGTSKTTETQPRLAASIGYGRRDRVGREKVFGEPADSGHCPIQRCPDGTWRQEIATAARLRAKRQLRLKASASFNNPRTVYGRIEAPRRPAHLMLGVAAARGRRPPLPEARE